MTDFYDEAMFRRSVMREHPEMLDTLKPNPAVDWMAKQMIRETATVRDKYRGPERRRKSLGGSVNTAV